LYEEDNFVNVVDGGGVNGLIYELIFLNFIWIIGILGSLSKREKRTREKLLTEEI